MGARRSTACSRVPWSALRGAAAVAVPPRPIRPESCAGVRRWHAAGHGHRGRPAWCALWLNNLDARLQTFATREAEESAALYACWRWCRAAPHLARYKRNTAPDLGAAALCPGHERLVDYLTHVQRIPESQPCSTAS